MNSPLWDDAAYDALADIWVVATPTEREGIEAAVHRVNAILRDRAADIGESRIGRIRVVIIEPLTIWFQVTPGDPVARVLHVRWWRKKRT